MPKAHITIATSILNPIGKYIYTVEYQLKKDSSNCRLSKGFCEVKEVSNLLEWKKIRENLTPFQAIIPGVPKGDFEIDVKIPMSSKNYLQPGEIARTREHLTQAPLQVIVFDYDEKGKTCEEVIQFFKEIFPEFKGLELLAVPSSSSGIKINENDEPTKNGVHVFAVLSDTVPYKALKDFVQTRCWARGVGIVKETRNGGLVATEPFDSMVLAPTALISVKAELGEGLILDASDFFYQEGGDSGSKYIEKIPTVTSADISHMKQLKKVEKAKYADSSEQTQAARVGELQGQLKVAPKTATQIVQRLVKNQELDALYPLYSPQYGDLNGVDLMMFPKKFHGIDLQDVDPTGEPRTDRTTAFVDQKYPIINTFDSGGGTYKLVRPIVDYNACRLDLVVKDINQILCSSRFPSLVNREGMVFHIDEADNGELKLRPVKPAKAKNLLSGLVNLCSNKEVEVTEEESGATEKKKTKRISTPTPFSDGLVRGWLAEPYGLPTVDIFSTLPVFKGGKLYAEEGYHSAIGAFITKKTTLALMEPEKALEYLESILCTFPFDSRTDRIGMIAIWLSAMQRHDLDFCPAFGLSANSPGTGKSLLIMAFQIILEEGLAFSNTVNNNDEMLKTMVGLLLQGHAAICFDNIKSGAEIDSELFCMLTTSKTLTNRLLGGNHVPTIKNKSMLIFTGNGISFGSDMRRRSLVVNLKTNVEKPEEVPQKREFADLVRDEKVRIISALFSILKYGKKMKRPNVVGTGSFVQWSRMIREPLYKLSGEDIWQLKARDCVDDDVSKLAELHEIWSFDEKTLKAAYALPQIKEWVDLNFTFNGQVNLRRCGKWLAGQENRPIDGRRLVCTGSSHRAKLYKIEAVK